MPRPRRYRRTLRVHYPAGCGRLVLRTEIDWDRDVEADAIEDDESCAAFEIAHQRPFLYFKPCLRTADGLAWSQGANHLATLAEKAPQEVYPYFRGSSAGSFAPIERFDSVALGRDHRLCVYLPPGYDDNPLRRCPVLYMQDGRNLFFPDEAFGGQEWRVDETLGILDAMSLIEPAIVVGVYSDRREDEYTLPGYEAYGRSLVAEVKPRVDAQFRTLSDRANTLVMGSSLGGVVSFYLGWQYPEVFRAGACLSSTFGWHDDLLERVLAEPVPDVFFYLDSGWPHDNYEATMSMALALIERGRLLGRDFIHLVFPEARHDAGAWAARLHLPMQLFAGRVRSASFAAHSRSAWAYTPAHSTGGAKP